MSDSATCEILTVEELAERLRVSRATIFTWLRKDVLTQGKHYFKQGRVLRFVWGIELVNGLLGGNVVRQGKPTVKRSPVKKSSPVNWDY